MALVTFGGGVSSIVGAIGGTVFSSGIGGAHARLRTMPCIRRSQRKQTVRTILGTYASKWKALTDVQRATWEADPQDTASGFHWFCQANLNRYYANPTLPLLTEAVAVPAWPEVATTGFEVHLTAGVLVRVAVLWFPASSPAGYSLQYWCTAGQSPGASYPEPQWFRLVRNSASYLFGEDTFGLFYRNTFGTPTVGRRVFLRAYLVHTASGARLFVGQRNTLVEEVV